MVEKRDYYEVLGLSREASADDIRRCYRQLALKYHPDRNPGDKGSEDKFKEATEAYSVLSDQEKRGLYDRFGHAGLGGAGVDFSQAGIGDILSHFQDMFSDFFGGFGGGFAGAGGRRRQGPERGQDIRVEAAISLKEAMTGCKHEVLVHGAAPCEECSGSGAKPGTKPEACSQCRGSGQVTTQRGFIMFSTTCPRCRGTGQFVASPCAACSGVGYVDKQRKVLVAFPPGIDAGQRLRVPGQGMPGRTGTPHGDLYVDVHVEPDERFERNGYDLATRVKVSFVEAALGGEARVELPDESRVTVEIAPGTQPGTLLTVKAQGMPRLDRRGRGDLHVLVEVHVPKKLSKRARKLLLELESELNTKNEREAHTA
jgi:molecular chaperone DnaJ